MEKLQELTDKIRREGVERGEAEAAQIIAKAQQQADKIVADAKTQADAIAQQAAKAATELETNTKNELKLYMAQAVNALKSEIANIVTDKVVAQAVDGATAEKDFIGRITVELAREWAGQGDIVITTAQGKELKSYFATQAKELLDKGVTINEVGGHPALFTISPADGSYRVDFGKQELEDYFKSFLRPQLIDMLF